MPAPSRKLVGFLVTYNRDPNGRSYNIYEGRNFIGRDQSCDICVPDDDQMSGRHMSILYRNVDDKFKFRDEQSSNGTFVNKELLDDGELQNYDIIRAGKTIFIFIAIPRIS
jgi:pSer/pThr/pTyr-binding forkhead associated (FHA) protein